ncbi:folate-binding protein YgfZ [Hydrogenophaga taeniospiralis CCUG 15921]|uniref:Folate-binding protein YgfZ n=1 Tax=Hydrogenophaga taeniospiralis CCUG 15921 TaxID=1281780 RepID=A0A9X4S6J1_9BURK|nr:folate-binding protein YgfZ [Hydrogenophaga taeniospiralis]MDG5973772.1 folate-binding protein YgfZ [Hydrogenophaga taeniospiralis CCUG 15921]
MTLVTPSTPAPTPDPARLQGATPLPHLGVIRAQGEDAAKFLHGQLTQDFSLLGLSEARLAGFCSAKGRMLASFVGFKRAHDDILLVCSRDVLAATLKRLSMFVLRAKVKLVDASDAFQIWGLAGGAALPGGAPKPWSLSNGPDGGQTVQLYPAAGVARALWVAPAEQPAPAGERLPETLWAWLEVHSGVATLTQPIVEAFVPQMLNYESVGGVNFKKGCYPGQEVVARSQFRGTLKRRAYLVHGDGPLQVGQEVFHDSDGSQPCGTVAAVAPHPEAGWDAIVSMQTSAAAGGHLHAGAADGVALTLLPLPYPLLDDI